MTLDALRGRPFILAEPGTALREVVMAAAQRAVVRLQRRGVDVVELIGSDAAHARRLLDEALEHGTDAVVVAGGDGIIGFEGQGPDGLRRTTTRLLDGEYPKVTSIFPTSVDSVVVIDTAHLIEAVRVALPELADALQQEFDERPDSALRQVPNLLIDCCTPASRRWLC